MLKVAINGFGRIGRLFLRQVFERKDIKIVAINDLGDLKNLAYLLKYDSVYGRYEKAVDFLDGKLIVDGEEINFFQIKNPEELPWRNLEVDVVIEATGVFEEFAKAKAHLEAGAKRVIITAPAKDEDGNLGKTILVGINEEEIKDVMITSNGSCTTNSVASVIKILSENPGIEKAVLNTVHAYTATQLIVDGSIKGNDLRRGRAGAQNIIPSTTGAAIAVTRAIKELKEKFDGIAMRVPVVAGSIADLTFLAKRKTSVEEINEILKEAAESEKWKGILKVTTEPLVSSDILGEPYGAIVDLSFTKVIDGDLVKVLSWYDNEAGYVATLIKHLDLILKNAN
jgi:glyceraldehyde 3-phosphate dehydrogenase